MIGSVENAERVGHSLRYTDEMDNSDALILLFVFMFIVACIYSVALYRYRRRIGSDGTRHDD
jgi:hypothetical protein